MKAKRVFNKEKIINFICLLSLIGFIFPQTANNTFGKESYLERMGTYPFMTLNKESEGLPEIAEKKPKETVHLTVTAYSSSSDECSGNPFITASGERVKDGTLAHNYLPFGTRVRFPEVYGNKIFTVEDRLAPGKSYYVADMWMPSKTEAKEWGAKVLKMEIL